MNKTPFITNLSESELKDAYLGMKQRCEDCKTVYRNFFAKSPCVDCEFSYMVFKLGEYFGDIKPR